MEEIQIKFKFTAEDLADIKHFCVEHFPGFNLLGSNCAEAISLTRNEAELLRSHLTTILARIGFDENYELNLDGNRIELLIDMLFVQ